MLQEIEGEGFACRELYVDTHAVNISAGAEEVASMFKMRIVPISGGIPQELAYAESAVRTLGANVTGSNDRSAAPTANDVGSVRLTCSLRKTREITPRNDNGKNT